MDSRHTRKLLSLSWFWAVVAALAAANLHCELPEQACWAVDCSERGTCALVSGMAVCLCDPGFVARELSCVDPQIDGEGPCDGVTCSNHGRCMGTTAENVHCMCDSGYVAEGLACVPADTGPDPCEGVKCSGHGYCMGNTPESAHCMCDTGYVAEGLTCVQSIQSGNQFCYGVDCSGHGYCMGSSAQNLHCMCDTGFVRQDRTNCVPG